MNDTMTVEETQNHLQNAREDLVELRELLGIAIAARDDEAAATARADLAEVTALIRDYEAALPVAQEREEARQAELRAEAERARQAAQNELRAAHLAACRKVDKALSALGKAYDELAATDRNVGGEFRDSSRCIRAREVLLRAAVHAASPALASDLRIQRPRASVRPLAEHEALMITEYE